MEEATTPISTNAADLLAKTKELGNKDRAEKKLFQVKGTVGGSVSGLAAGLMIGYFKGYNLILSGFAGIVIGGAISHFVLRADNNSILNSNK